MDKTQECPLCKGTGVYHNRPCYCIIKNILLDKAPQLARVKKSKKLLTDLSLGKSKLDGNYLITREITEANQIVATYLVYQATICGNLDFEFSNCLDAQDLIFSDEDSISKLVKPRILIYYLLGVKHKALPLFLYQAFQTRLDMGKQTIIVVSNPKASRTLRTNYPDLEPIINQLEEIK